MDSRAEFDAKDMELLDQAHRETEAAEAAASAEQAGAGEAGTEGQEKPAVAAPAPATAATAPAPAPAGAAPAVAAPAAPATPAAPAADAQGSAKAALRASRHQEKLLRDENAALRKRIEEAGGNAAAAEATKPDETQLNDVREYAPTVGKHLDALERENAELRARVKDAPTPESAFKPIEYAPDIQAAIDEVPELLLWHSTPEHQKLFDLAIRADGILAQLDQWDGKPLAERFAAAVAEVKAKTGTPSKASTAKTLEDAQRVIAAATAAPAAPLAVGDLRGGATPASNSIPDYHAMKKAGRTDEDIIASLPELP